MYKVAIFALKPAIIATTRNHPTTTAAFRIISHLFVETTQ